MTAIASVLPTGDAAINGVLYGYKWAATSLTFSFPSSGSFYGSGYGSNENITGFAVFNPTQQSAVRSILASYASVINFSFSEITETTTQHAELRYATSTLPSTAWAYLPTTFAEGGDAWFGVTNNWYVNPVVGNYAWLTFVHETGHALGLKHPHAASGTFGVMPAAFDSLEYTVMSYRSYVGGPATGYTVEGYGFPQTLMMYDVAALQEMYGANYTTNSGDTVYKWDPLTGQQYINGIGQAVPGANRILMNVWDGGGRDTYDFSNYTNPTTNLKIDLNPGGWTTTSTAQLSTLAAGHIATGNISNSLLYHGNTASLIEDAVGGIGNDVITGNVANNRLTGGAGNDTLDGEAGTDTAVYSGLTSNYQLVQNVNGSWTVTDLRGGSPDGTDTLTDIELIQFSNELILISTIQPVPPLQVPTFTSFSNDSGTPGDRITNDNTLAFAGSGTAGSIVSLFRSGALLGTAEVDSFGAWTFATAPLADGVHSFTANATNVAANTSATSAAYVITIDRTAPNTPTISGYTPDSHILGDGKTRFATLTLNGSAEASSLVHIFDGATLLGTTSASAGGAWSFTTYDPALAAPSLACACPACAAMAAAPGPTAQSGDGITGVLSDGAHVFTVRAADAAGNLSAVSAALNVTIDTAAPATPSIQMFSPDSGVLGDGKTRIQVLTLSGTAEALSTVEVYDGATQLGTATASSAGSWTYFTPTLGYGVHSFTAKAIDDAGNTSAASSPFTVTIDPNAPAAVNLAPVVNANNITAARGQVFAASSLFSVTDANFDPIASYRFYDSNAAANSGYFVVKGVAQPGLSTVAVTASELSQVTYIAGAGTESISVTASDGLLWSAWKAFTITAPNAAPIIALSPTPVYNNQTVALSSLFTAADADNDAITQYQIIDATTASTSGHFINNGVAQTAMATLTLTSQQFSQVSYAAGTTANSIMIHAFDGVTWGAWKSFTVTPVNRAPVVTASNVSAAAGQGLAAASLFSATDPDGDVVTQYQLQDITADAASGYFTVNNVTQSATTIFTVTSAQLSQTKFFAGAVGDTLMVRAFDGTTWSGWSTFSVSPLNSNTAPAVTTANLTAGRNQSLAVSTMFSASDVDNDPMTQYQIQDSTAGATSGYFTVNGVTQLAATPITIAAGQLPQTTFVVGSIADSLMVRAFDGSDWSDWSTFSVTPVNIAPVVNGDNLTATARGQVFAASSLFSVTDANFDPIASYRFYDSNAAANSGYFVVKGVAQPGLSTVAVTASELSQVTYIAGAGTESISVTASDGLLWSAWKAFTITAPNAAPIIALSPTPVYNNQTVALSSLFTAADADNDAITQYQIIDATTTSTSGHFINNGVAQTAMATLTLTSQQFSQVSYAAGTTADSIMIHAFDGVTWGAWKSFTVTPVLAAGGSAGLVPVVTGTAASDALVSTAASEVVIGADGADTIVFAPNFGKDTVKDFQTTGEAHDSLQFAQSVFTDVADILAHASQNGPDVVITADAENSVTLQNVTLSVLQQHQNDLLFLA